MLASKSPSSEKASNSRKADNKPPKGESAPGQLSRPLWNTMATHVQRTHTECEEGTSGQFGAVIQTKPNDSASQHSVPGIIANAITSPSGGLPLNESVRSRIEPVLGADLSGVRVHSDAAAQNASHSLNARAFTHQNNIFLGKGQSAADEQLMAHEATHVLQQAGGTTTVQRDNFETTTTTATPVDAESSLAARPTRSSHEIVIMSGGPTSHRMDPDHDANPLNYATAARIRIQRLMESAFGDQRQMLPTDKFSWVIMRPPYRYRASEDGEPEDAYINLISTRSVSNLRRDWNRLRDSWLQIHPDEASSIPTGDSAISVHFVDSSAEFVEFMNNGSGETGRSGVSYIGRFEYFGHGVPGTLWFSMGWTHIGSSDITFSNDDVASLDTTVFVSTAEYRSWSCNTATPSGVNATSFAQAWVEHLGGRFVGAVGRTTYEFILDRSNPSGQVLLSREESAHWQTVTATASSAMTGAQPGEVSEQASEEGQSVATESDEQVCRAEIVPLEEPAYPGDLVCTDEGAGHINVEPVPVAEGGTSDASVLRGRSCACDESAIFFYDAQTFVYIRRIGSLIKSAAKDKGVPVIAVAGSIADEYNTRRGHRVALDAAQDALLDSLAEWQIDIDRFFDFDNKLLNAMRNDVGMANINIRTALQLVQRGELIVPGSPQSSPRVTKVIDYLLTNRGTARTAAAVIARAQGLFSSDLGGYSGAMREAVYVTYFKQGSSYYFRAWMNSNLNPEHEICPGDGGCRVMRNRSKLDSALR